MSSSRGFLNGYVLPGIIFPTLTALAVYYIKNSLTGSGLADEMAAHCPAAPSSAHAFRLHYTSVHAIDTFLCNLVAFFHALLEPQPSAVLTYFAGTSAPLLAIPFIESHRKDRHFLVAWPLIIGLLGQTITVGMTMTVYWLVFIWTGASSRRANVNARVTQAHAEAMVFAILTGVGIPSAGLMILKDPKVTALWQIFPVYVSVAYFAYTLFRPASRHPQSGYKTIRGMYIGMFISAALVHLATVGSKLLDPPALAAFAFPSTTPLPATASMLAKAEDFLKWDAVFAFGSSVIATLWFARDPAEVLVIASWHLFAVPLLGPSAAVAGVALWREASLNEDEVEVEINGKKQS